MGIVIVGIIMTTMKTSQMMTNKTQNMSIGPIGTLYNLLEENVDNLMNPKMKDKGLNEPGFKAKRAKAYSKITKAIVSCTSEEQLEVCLRMIENYERLMLNFYLTSHLTKQETKQSAIDLLSLIKLKRKQIRRK
jgi:hypothetical protein